MLQEVKNLQWYSKQFTIAGARVGFYSFFFSILRKLSEKILSSLPGSCEGQRRGACGKEPSEEETLYVREKRQELQNTSPKILVQQRSRSLSEMVCQETVSQCWISCVRHNGNFSLCFIPELRAQRFCVTQLWCKLEP